MDRDGARVTGVQLRSRTIPDHPQRDGRDLGRRRYRPEVRHSGAGWLRSAIRRPTRSAFASASTTARACSDETPPTLGGCRQVQVAIPPGGRQGGLALAVEADRWLVTLVGSVGERPPSALEEFIEYARTAVEARPPRDRRRRRTVGEAATGAFPAYLRHRYDRLRRFPGHYVVTGDALCSLNPVYAQGMSVAIRDAQVLGEVLDRHGLDRVGPRFFRRTRPVIDTAWKLASGADWATRRSRDAERWGGECSTGTSTACSTSPTATRVVADAFLRVNAMVAPPPHLFRPRIVARTLRGGSIRGGHDQPERAVARQRAAEDHDRLSLIRRSNPLLTSSIMDEPHPNVLTYLARRSQPSTATTSEPSATTLSDFVYRIPDTRSSPASSMASPVSTTSSTKLRDESAGTIELTPPAVLADDHNLIARARVTAERAGKRLDTENCYAFLFVDGKVADGQVFVSQTRGRRRLLDRGDPLALVTGSGRFFARSGRSYVASVVSMTRCWSKSALALT